MHSLGEAFNWLLGCGRPNSYEESNCYCDNVFHQVRSFPSLSRPDPRPRTCLSAPKICLLKPRAQQFKGVWQRTRRKPTPGMPREPTPPAECRLRCLPTSQVLPKGERGCHKASE